ncbi:nucleotidyltransferase family protein [Edaphobacter sp.]|uniref:nucleotidyltransferase family protein n=1 Tax=Edaphobacter sp. TaxID=1934404 RepID=UPI002D7F81E2|nr:nucleotidyltransferase family protein [Edaphobacter sp.]
MRPSEALRLHRDEIRSIVESSHASNPRVFGSVLLGEDTEQSDLDILVDTPPQTSIFDIGEIRYRLRNLLGVSVDVLTSKALHKDFRDRIISEAQPI